ncbi:uncharacterized protein si:ch211-133n4.6 isoform X3 [Anguilla anguilla]|uniref:uncharacterized protein si:ch211-133n4.6 isoform X3 n=1 Tax=Anguilla anguilla TaxID=7936 RepID=UPI0015A7F57F|nr:uncharacterized protein si:ch211-133n4.6 isoform X3 [Anguilla anguilla]
MLFRDILLLCSLAVVLVKGDLDADGGAQAMSTDHDSTSDEVPTESMNSISPDQPNDPSSTSAEADHSDGHQPGNDANGSSDVTKSSIEDHDDESPDSDEGPKHK